jgi:PAS domain-containing protein
MRLDGRRCGHQRGARCAAGAAPRHARHRSRPSAARGAVRPGNLEFSRDLARQLSAAIENVQLLDDILRQRRLLEDTFNSLVDLVAVMDKELRIVQTNDAFAARVGLKRTRHHAAPLRELVGADTFAYVEAPTPGRDRPGVQRRVDDRELDGTFLLTATPLTSQDGQTLGRVLVARDITRQTRLEAERAALPRALDAVGEARLARPVRRRHRARDEQSAAGRDGAPRAAHRDDRRARPVKKELKQIFQEADRAAKIVRNLLVFTGSHRIARQKTQVDRVLTARSRSRKAHLPRPDQVVRRRAEAAADLVRSGPPPAGVS